MARYQLRQLAFDTNQLDRLVGFWAEALGYELDHRTADYAVLRDPDGAEPKIFLQLVPEPKLGKNRAHIDVEVPDEQAAVTRLVDLGATVLWRNAEDSWTVLADPDGNEFCVGSFG
jgi:catechol 2,3-dioxygenase-like lactoylglutathione lyase family enzyme